MSHVCIFDTTLRDGEQGPGFAMSIRAKLRIARQLARLGVDVIEAGFPVSSDADFQGTCAIANTIGREPSAPTICGLARVVPKDIDICWRALSQAKRPRIHVFVATSDLHLEYKLKRSRASVLASAVAAVRHARGYCEDVEFSAEDASRTDLSYLAEVVEGVIDAGAKTINVPDTVGFALPEEWKHFLLELQDRVPALREVTLSVHCHDDLGMATANTIAGVEAGARQVECTINGIGERAGNAALEEVVMALRTRRDRLLCDVSIDSTRLLATSQLLSKVVGVAPPPNKAIVGENAFAHEAGIHQDGMIKDPRTYEIMSPATIGRASSSLVLGKHSGRHALRRRIEDLGLELSESDVDRAYARFKKVAELQKEVTDAELLALVDPAPPTVVTVENNSHR